MRIIDAHFHLETDGEAVLLREMDANGIEKAVVCPSRACVAVVNERGNHYIAAAVQAHPQRMIGFAVANPWFGEEAIEQLKKARNLGLRGLKINSAIRGFSLRDPMITPLLQLAEEAYWPAYCHSGTPIHALPFQVAELAEQIPKVRWTMPWTCLELTTRKVDQWLCS